MKISTGSSALSRFASTLMLIGGLCLVFYGDAQAVDKMTAEEINQQTRELLKSLKEFSVEQRDEAIQKTKAALDNLDNRINHLEASIVANWDKMNQDAREQSRLSLKAMRDQRTRVAEGYGSLKSGSAGAWEQIKFGFSSAYSALHNSWQEAEKSFSSNE